VISAGASNRDGAVAKTDAPRFLQKFQSAKFPSIGGVPGSTRRGG